MKRNLLLVVLLLISSSMFAQSIHGKITDGNKEPVIGATVVLEGTSNAAITDALGNYTLSNLKPGKYKIKVSLLGYRTIFKQVELGTQKMTFNFTIFEESKNLQDVVVVGYGTKLRRELTGSIASLNAKELNDLPVPSFESALQGKLPGVQVTTGSGIAGSAAVIRIRGIASISAGGDPLYVIDGIPITQDYFLRGNSGAANNNPLAAINPDDIESIDILKDAAANAIYGSRGSNGVVLITTKRAKKGTNISYTGSVGTSQPTALPNMLNNEQFLQLYQEAYENDGGVGLAPLPNNISWDDARNTNTDWVDLTTRTGIKHSHNVGVSRGGKNFSILGNISYGKNESFLVGNSYDRTSIRINGDVRPMKDLKLGFSTSLSSGVNYRVNTAWAGGLGAAMSTALPIFPVYNPDGSYFTAGDNPVRTQELKKWRSQEYRTINGLNAEYAITSRLSVNANANLDYMVINDDEYSPREFIFSQHAGTATRNQVNTRNYNYFVQLNYDVKLPAGHKLKAMGGYEFQKSRSFFRNKTANGMTDGFYNPDAKVDDSLYTYNASLTTSNEWKFNSYFTRLSYSFRNKIFLEGTLRADGSSRFGENVRVGIFPGASIGWLITEESFMQAIPSISLLKLKASYGKSGNANISETARFAQYGVSPNGYNGQTIRYPLQIGNPDLKWETSLTSNIGIDLGLFRDRITLTAEYYNRNTTGVLMDLALPTSTGYSGYYGNVGEINNNGFEFSITSRNIDRDFKWTTQFNIARNKNKILSIGPFSEDAVSGGTNDTRVVVGQPVGTNYLVRFSRIDPETGRPIYLDINGNETYVWDPANRVPVGSVLPDAIGGLTNTFSYKNWDLSVLFNFVLGGDIYESSAKRQLGVVTNWNMRSDIFDRWQKPGDIAAFPRLTLETETYGSGTPWINTTMWLHDGTFARLRNLTIAYRVPRKTLDKLKIQTARIAFIGTNLLTFTKYPGLDPEIARDFENPTDRNMSSNITYLTPPQEKTYTLQLSVTF